MGHNIEDRKDSALAAFRGFDVDGDGTVTSEEMEKSDGESCWQAAPQISSGLGTGSWILKNSSCSCAVAE